MRFSFFCSRPGGSDESDESDKSDESDAQPQPSSVLPPALSPALLGPPSSFLSRPLGPPTSSLSSPPGLSLSSCPSQARVHPRSALSDPSDPSDLSDSSDKTYTSVFGTSCLDRCLWNGHPSDAAYHLFDGCHILCAAGPPSRPAPRSGGAVFFYRY